jgi:hypothetical protein
LHSCAPFSVSVVFAPDERRQEFHVKPATLFSELVVRGWRLVFAQELLFETRADQAIPQILLLDFERDGNSNVGVEGKQWFVGNCLGERMISEKPVCPAADDDHLRKPGIKSLNQLG